MAKALIINTSSSLVLLYFSVLKQIGLEVNALEGFSIALDHIKNEKPDILFVSLTEPVEVMYEFIADCASLYPDLPIVVMHIPFDRYSVPDAFKSGAKYALEEPVTRKRFEILLHSIGLGTPQI